MVQIRTRKFASEIYCPLGNSFHAGGQIVNWMFWTISERLHNRDLKKKKKSNGYFRFDFQNLDYVVISMIAHRDLD